MIIHKCDKCGIPFEQKKGEGSATPEGWQSIRPAGYGAPVFEVCEVCAPKLGFTTGKEKDVGEQLIDILYDLMTEVAQENASP